MALFGRASLPAPSTLSRFLAALPGSTAGSPSQRLSGRSAGTPAFPEEHATGLWDREGTHWLVFDVDGTREAARQRALPQTPDRPAPQRRLRPLCAPGYTGRKRGEIVRTRTTVLQMHTHQWVASFGNPGNGQYREELRRAKTTIQEYIKAHGFPAERTLVRASWPIWDRSSRLRPGRFCVRDPRQRLQPPRARRRPGALALAC
jgi:hypothetical protein